MLVPEVFKRGECYEVFRDTDKVFRAGIHRYGCWWGDGGGKTAFEETTSNIDLPSCLGLRLRTSTSSFGEVPSLDCYNYILTTALEDIRKDTKKDTKVSKVPRSLQKVS